MHQQASEDFDLLLSRESRETIENLLPLANLKEKTLRAELL